MRTHGGERETLREQHVFLAEAGSSCPKSAVQAEAARSGAAGSLLLLPFSATTVPGAPLCSVSMTQAGTRGSQPGCLPFPASPCFPLCLFSCEYIWKLIGGEWAALTLQKEECGKDTVFSTLSDWYQSSFLLIETIHYGFEIALTTQAGKKKRNNFPFCFVCLNMNSTFYGADQAKVNKMLYVASEETVPLPLIFPSRIILVWKSCNFAWCFPKRERNKITWANIDVFYHKEMNSLHRNTGSSHASGKFCFLCICYPSEVRIAIGILLLRLQGWVVGYGLWTGRWQSVMEAKQTMRRTLAHDDWSASLDCSPPSLPTHF